MALVTALDRLPALYSHGGDLRSPPQFDWTGLPFKLRLVEELGVDEAFRTYAAMLGLAPRYTLRKLARSGLRQHAKKHGVAFHEIAPAGTPFAVPAPKVSGLATTGSLHATTRSFFVACLADATVRSGSSIVYAGERALIDREPRERDLPPDYLELNPFVFHTGDEHVWTIDTGLAPIDVGEAFVSLVGTNAYHFGHWLWEYLPKYATAVRSKRLPRVPILLNADPRSRLHDAVDRLLPGVDIIAADPLRPMLVRRAWCAPALCYVPLLERFEAVYPGLDYQCISGERFLATIDNYQRRAEEIAGNAAGDARLYLARRPHQHKKLLNAERIEALARARGFTVVYPDALPFEQQVRLVRSSSHVLAPEGSAVLLLLFARGGTNLCILSPPYTLDVTTYAHHLRDAGVDVTVFTGPALRTHDALEYPTCGLPTHADYEIDEERLAAFLDDWLS